MIYRERQGAEATTSSVINWTTSQRERKKLFSGFCRCQSSSVVFPLTAGGQPEKKILSRDYTTARSKGVVGIGKLIRTRNKSRSRK